MNKYIRNIGLLLAFGFFFTMLSAQDIDNKLKTEVEKNFKNLDAHAAYIKAIGVDNPELEKVYEGWMATHPDNAVIPYAIGKAFADKESPRAKPYLLKAVEIDPNYTQAWGDLWIDGERWGNFAQAREYLRNATESDPSDPGYAFYYASTFEKEDWNKYVEMSMDVVKRFPNDERGAQALYWLGERSRNMEDKKAFFERLRAAYAPTKYRWSSSGMYSYFDILLSEDPKKAIEIAKDMAKDEKKAEEWSGLRQQAELVLKIDNLMKRGDTRVAIDSLDKLKLPRYFGFNKEIPLLKAKAFDMGADPEVAYQSLVEFFAKSPTPKVKSQILKYGAKLGKNGKDVEGDLWKQLDAVAKTATPFDLKPYKPEDKGALADYKGKVVLLTYWFPGCGPCRGEFPHFENVIRKFDKKDVAYLAINIVSDQNDYVLPFIKSSGYSFVALEDVEGREKGNLDNRGAAPMNFIIDKQGKLLFSGFMINGNNEDELELMIKTALQKAENI